jgi:hypothetical protein
MAQQLLLEASSHRERMNLMQTIRNLYNWSPAFWNALLAAVLILFNHFLPDYSEQLKAMVDALIALLSGVATYTQVTPVAKLDNQVAKLHANLVAKSRKEH